jgi:3-phenylpropionate/trans-cinnamate dioxygenase ferredoxin reductase component
MPDIILTPNGALEEVPERIVVVGASLAGLSAARTLRGEGFAGQVTVVGDETHLPYDRPPLSKQFLGGLDELTDLGSADVANVEWILGVAAVGLDVQARTLALSDGRTLRFDGLVITTGASPRRLPGFDKSGVHTIRTASDAADFRRALAGDSPRVALIGAGFIGAEIASTCITLGLPVTMIEVEPVPFGRTLGVAVGAELSQLYISKGVDLRAGRSIKQVLGDEHVTGLELDDGSVIEADVVVLSVGVVPATTWLESSGLPLDNGVICDDTLQVAPGIVAAGDVARWPNERLGEFRRVEHWENAITSGGHAARTLLGSRDKYNPIPWVWSDQFGFKLQFVGSSINHEEVFLESSLDSEGRLIALYRKEDRLIGACGIRRSKAVLSLRDFVGVPGSWHAAMKKLGLAPSIA